MTAAALPLPPRAFDPFVPETAKVDKHQTVRFDTNRYSVPRRWAFATVTIKAYVDRIEVVSGPGIIARHERHYTRGEWIMQPDHYLAILGRRPAALDHSFVFAEWKLPACFDPLRADFEQRAGLAAGARQYVRVLQLLAEYPAPVVQEAITHCRQKTTVNADHILATVRRRGDRSVAGEGKPRPDPNPSPGGHVPLPMAGPARESLLDREFWSLENASGHCFGSGGLLDRLTHHCHIIEMNGESYRFRESVKKSKPAKQ